jgi:phage FluMu gp28-like protein
VEFENGARLTSLPGRPPRGRARANVYLDEFAHVRLDREIYQAALPITSKGGRIRIGSSPFGASGVFWEVASQAMRAYPGYTRASTPWWLVQAFCTDVPTAHRLAPGMPTAERVARFGRQRIQVIYENSTLDDFQQEYECLFVDESTAWITWEEIRANQQTDLACQMATVEPGNLAPALEAIEQLARDAQLARVEPVLAAGFDVGRTRNASELFIVGLGHSGDRPLRLAIQMDRLAYDDQFDVLALALRRLPLVGLWIDKNGIGNNLAENLSRQWPGLAQGIQFTNESKRLWATNVKMLLQQHRASIPVHRDLAYQIHSIKRLITPSKNLIFDTDGNEKHHADKFWAWSLALAAAGQDEYQPTDDEILAAFNWQQTL